MKHVAFLSQMSYLYNSFLWTRFTILDVQASGDSQNAVIVHLNVLWIWCSCWVWFLFN